jgi:hypothetical protein
MVEDHNAIAYFKFPDTGADLGYDSGGFMAVNAGGSEEIVLDLLEIGVANAAGFHAHQDFTGADSRSGYILNGDDGSAFVYGGGHGRRNSVRRLDSVRSCSQQ